MKVYHISRISSFLFSTTVIFYICCLTYIWATREEVERIKDNQPKGISHLNGIENPESCRSLGFRFV